MSFDIIIPTFRRSRSLGRTLQVLGDGRLPSQLEAVHVVENGPVGDAAQLCESLAGNLPIRYHYLAEPGLSGARNAGIMASRADFLLFIDDDVRPLPGALSGYAEAFERFPAGAFFGGPMVADYECAPAPWLTEFLPDSAKGFDLGESEQVLDQPVFLGGNFAVARAALEEFGLFEGPSATGTKGGGLGEETRLQRRMLKGGYKAVYVPSARVMHHVPRSNCTVKFVKHRRWRRGYGEGQLGAHAKGNSRLFLDVPVWYWKELMAAGKGYASSVFRLEAKGKRFRKLLQFYQCLGRVSGYRTVRTAAQTDR